MATIFEFLEQFFRSRKSPEELVATGILKEDPTLSDSGKFFHKPLSDVPKIDGIPTIVVKCCEYLEFNNGFTEEGIFRVPGSAEEIKIIKQKFDDLGDCDLTGFEVSSVAGVLKLYLRELPEPLFMFQFYPTLINIAREHSHDEPKLLETLRNAILAIPVQNSELIFFLTNFLQKCSKFSEISKMGVDNLAMVFAPNVLRPETETLQQIMSDSNYIKVLLRTLIKYPYQGY